MSLLWQSTPSANQPTNQPINQTTKQPNNQQPNILKSDMLSGVVTHVYNPSTQEAEEGRLKTCLCYTKQVQVQSGQLSETSWS